MRTSAGATQSGDRLFYGDIQGKKHIVPWSEATKADVLHADSEMLRGKNFHTLTRYLSSSSSLAGSQGAVAMCCVVFFSHVRFRFIRWSMVGRDDILYSWVL